ncbi:MAG: hypothetical protein DMF88_12290 [Acidobacteria bacterium]|nr:MAG: hypothetical protein DMF88_12290 [Acidobacteriota bacterium]
MRMLATLIVAVVLGAAPARAHHSFAAEFDSKKPVTLTGSVTKVEWLNPHVRFYADVKDQDGAVHNWEFELGSGTSLVRQGWTRTSLKPADIIKVEGFLARDGSRLVNAVSVSTADGKKLFAGSSFEGAPKQ